MSGALSVLPMYAFMVWTKKALPFYITVSCLASQLSCCLYCFMLQSSKICKVHKIYKIFKSFKKNPIWLIRTFCTTNFGIVIMKPCFHSDTLGFCRICVVILIGFTCSQHCRVMYIHAVPLLILLDRFFCAEQSAFSSIRFCMGFICAHLQCWFHVRNTWDATH